MNYQLGWGEHLMKTCSILPHNNWMLNPAEWWKSIKKPWDPAVTLISLRMRRSPELCVAILNSQAHASTHSRAFTLTRSERFMCPPTHYHKRVCISPKASAALSLGQNQHIHKLYGNPFSNAPQTPMACADMNRGKRKTGVKSESAAAECESL